MIDRQKLEIAAQNVVTAALISHLAKRTNDSKTTTADLLTTLKKPDGSTILRGDAILTLKSLAEAGCGVFLAGRRGQKTRLEWEVSALQTSQSLLTNGRTDIDETHHIEPHASSILLKDTQTYELRFPLRLGYNVLLDIPIDLDADERERLAKAISALPVS